MDQDLEQKKRHRHSHSQLKSAQSRFFAHVDAMSATDRRRHSDGVTPIAGPSRMHAGGGGNKENLYVAVEDETVETSEPELDASDLSLQAQVDDIDGQMNLNIGEFPDAVEQEDGYISPSPSCSKEVQDLSSPPGPSRRQRVSLTGVIPSDDEKDDADADFGVDAVSSPISVKKSKPRSRFHSEKTPTRWIAKSRSKSKFAGGGQVLVEPTPSPKGKERLYRDIEDVPSPTLFRGPDLRNMLGDDDETVLDFNANDNGGKPKSASRSASSSSPCPETPNFTQQQAAQMVDVVDVDNFDYEDLEDDDDVRRKEELTAQSNAVMAGWRQQWALPTKTPARRPAQQQQQHTSAPQYPIHPSSPNSKKAKFTPGSSRPARMFNLRRSDTNITPAGRHTLADYKPPRSAPSKLLSTATNNTAMNPPSIKHLGMSKPRRNLLLFEAVKKNPGGTSSASSQQKARQTIDLTLDDDFEDDDDIEELDPILLSDDQVMSSARARLSQFRRVEVHY